MHRRRSCTQANITHSATVNACSSVKMTCRRTRAIRARISSPVSTGSSHGSTTQWPNSGGGLFLCQLGAACIDLVVQRTATDADLIGRLLAAAVVVSSELSRDNSSISACSSAAALALLSSVGFSSVGGRQSGAVSTRASSCSRVPPAASQLPYRLSREDQAAQDTGTRAAIPTSEAPISLTCFQPAHRYRATAPHRRRAGARLRPHPTCQRRHRLSSQRHLYRAAHRHLLRLRG